MRRDAHNVRKTLKMQNASRMYVLDMCGYKKWVLQPQLTYRQPPQAHSAHSNMGGSEALTIKGGLPQANRLFVGLIVQIVFGMSVPAWACTLKSRGVEPLEKGEPGLTLQANPPQWDAERGIRGKARGPSKSTE